jgi:GPCR proteolysis site, GPS, motif
MVSKSNLSCVFWDYTLQKWSKDGCQLQGIDKDHINCNCTHLSAFTILFTTPKLTIDAPLLENSTIAATTETKRNISISDIVRWPLSAYFANLKKLWQHNRPSLFEFIVKPGFAVLILFWAMYFSSLIYYSGQDDLKRFAMTK